MLNLVVTYGTLGEPSLAHDLLASVGPIISRRRRKVTHIIDGTRGPSPTLVSLRLTLQPPTPSEVTSKRVDDIELSGFPQKAP